jgi:hypothetical protein
MNAGGNFHVMATHTIQYNGEEGKVEVLQHTYRVPEFFFLVTLPSLKVMLSRHNARPDLWNGGFTLSLQDAKALGESIEEQIGYKLPLRPSNNPFIYTGDIHIKVESFKIGGLRIGRAKAPYTNDVYYEIKFSKERKLVMVRMDIDGDISWTYEGSLNLSEKDFNLFKSMLSHFEEAYQLRIYTPSNEA